MCQWWQYEWLKGQFRGTPPICGICRAERRYLPWRWCPGCLEYVERTEFSYDARGWAKSRCCNRCEWKRRPLAARKAASQRAGFLRRTVRTLSWDGVTDLEILDRDGWRCQMPVCVASTREIRAVDHPDPWSPSVDHITPISRGGDHTAGNRRAAHLRCNIRSGNRALENSL